MDTTGKMAEIIKCKCGNTFAACAVGYQDEEWRESLREYIQGGCTVEFIKTENLDLGCCDCPKTPEQHRDRSQLKLF